MVAVARRGAALTIAALALLALPHLLPAYYLNLTTQVLFYAIFAMSLDLLVGYTGLTSLGHASFFGVAPPPPGQWLHADAGAGVPHR